MLKLGRQQGRGNRLQAPGLALASVFVRYLSDSARRGGGYAPQRITGIFHDASFRVALLTDPYSSAVERRLSSTLCIVFLISWIKPYLSRIEVSV